MDVTAARASGKSPALVALALLVSLVAMPQRARAVEHELEGDDPRHDEAHTALNRIIDRPHTVAERHRS